MPAINPFSGMYANKIYFVSLAISGGCGVLFHVKIKLVYTFHVIIKMIT